jgi:hypothetical protein
MDQFTHRIVRFGIHHGAVDGSALCRMFTQAVQQKPLPKHLRTDNDSLSRFHQLQANLQVLELTEVKTVLSVSLSHPFAENLMEIIRIALIQPRFYDPMKLLLNRLFVLGFILICKQRKGRIFPDSAVSH